MGSPSASRSRAGDDEQRSLLLRSRSEYLCLSFADGGGVAKGVLTASHGVNAMLGFGLSELPGFLLESSVGWWKTAGVVLANRLLPVSELDGPRMRAERDSFGVDIPGAPLPYRLERSVACWRGLLAVDLAEP